MHTRTAQKHNAFGKKNTSMYIWLCHIMMWKTETLLHKTSVTYNKEVMFYTAFVCLLATSQKNYWLDLRENFTRDVEITVMLSGNFLEGLFNIARQGILPKCGSYLWKKWSDFHENFITEYLWTRKSLLNFMKSSGSDMTQCFTQYVVASTESSYLSQAVEIWLQLSANMLQMLKWWLLKISATL